MFKGGTREAAARAREIRMQRMKTSGDSKVTPWVKALVTKLENLMLASKTHAMERKDRFLKFVLCPPQLFHGTPVFVFVYRKHTHTHTNDN